MLKRLLWIAWAVLGSAAAGQGSAPPAVVSVGDIIGMTTIGSKVQGYGDEDYDVVSPDGGRVAVVVTRGDLATNTRTFALMVFRTGDLLSSAGPPRADTVVTMASNSNRPAISAVRWAADNQTLVFLGEHQNELPQVYTVDLTHRHPVQRTHATTLITQFDYAASTGTVVYAAESAPDTSDYASKRGRGFVVEPTAEMSDIIAGAWGWHGPSYRARAPGVLRVVRGGQDSVATVPLPDSAAGYLRCSLLTFTVAPSGDRVIIDCMPRELPARWAGYQQKWFHDIYPLGYHWPVYVVVDLASGQNHPLFDGPSVIEGNIVWAPDGRSVVLGNALLPLEGPDSAARAQHGMVAEIDVGSGRVTTVARRDSLTAVAWGGADNTVTLVPGAHLQPAEVGRVYYRRSANRWEPVRGAPARTVPSLVIQHTMNTPPRLMAVDPSTRATHLVFDPNPGLMASRRFANETVLHWRTKAGAAWVGGIYWPVDYVAGKRYPLVIQTHGFDSTGFWPDGIYATGEAAQPLAGQGVVVVQMGSPPGAQWVTPREGPLFQEGAEALIDHLDSAGVIDRTKVGMQGFSRTCFYTLYFLTHSSYRLAAATVTDGVDVSYLQHMIFQPMYVGAGVIQEDEKMIGGPPWGAGLALWRERAPGFNLDKVSAPLLLTALQPFSLLEEWEPYAGLLLQGKPTELWYIPDAEHILTKPWERLTSQQGAEDWFRFWLQGAERDDAPTGQYARWRAMRVAHTAS